MPPTCSSWYRMGPGKEKLVRPCTRTADAAGSPGASGARVVHAQSPLASERGRAPCVSTGVRRASTDVARPLVGQPASGPLTTRSTRLGCPLEIQRQQPLQNLLVRQVRRPAVG